MCGTDDPATFKICPSFPRRWDIWLLIPGTDVAQAKATQKICRKENQMSSTLSSPIWIPPKNVLQPGGIELVNWERKPNIAKKKIFNPWFINWISPKRELNPGGIELVTQEEEHNITKKISAELKISSALGSPIEFHPRRTLFRVVLNSWIKREILTSSRKS